MVNGRLHLVRSTHIAGIELLLRQLHQVDGERSQALFGLLQPTDRRFGHLDPPIDLESCHHNPTGPAEVYCTDDPEVSETADDRPIGSR
jgi:hypothetical protein